MRLNEVFAPFVLSERKVHVVDALRPYQDDPSIYITFSDLQKVGVNPQPKYNTPIGIYAYPLKAVWDQVMFNSLPFAGDRPFIHVLRSVGNMLDLASYSIPAMKQDVARLRSLVVRNEQDGPVFDDLVNRAIADAKQKVPAGEIWNITRVIAARLAQEAGGKQVSRWNAVFRSLGYDGAADFGEGIIHENEPFQAVFFSKLAVQHVATVANTRNQPFDQSLKKRIQFKRLLDLEQWLYDLQEDGDRPATSLTHRLAQQWPTLLSQGKSENFELTDPKLFKTEMTSNLLRLVSILTMSPKLIPIAIAELVAHPMQSERAWTYLIKALKYTSSTKLIRLAFAAAKTSPDAAELKVALSNAALYGLLYRKVGNYHGSSDPQEHQREVLALVRQVIRPIASLLDPAQITDDALIKRVDQMFEDAIPF